MLVWMSTLGFDLNGARERLHCSPFMKRFVEVTLISGAILVGSLLFLFAVAALTAPLWQWSWVKDLPPVGDVRIEPARPVLKLSDVQSGSAFDLLRRAADLEAKIKRPKSFDVEAIQLNLFPWSDEKFPAVVKVLNESRQAMELARQATTVKNPQMPTYTSPTDGMPHILMPILQIETMFRASAAKKVAGNDLPGAFSDLNTSIDVADVLSRGGVGIDRFGEIAAEGRAFAEMRFIASQHDLPSPTTQQTIHHLSEIDRKMEPWAEIYREEYRVVPDAVGELFGPSGRPVRPGILG